MRSKAFQEGIKAKSYHDNTYSPGSAEFNEFERGQTQKLKRSSSVGLDYSFYIVEPLSLYAKPIEVVKPKPYKYKSTFGK
ncbi:hypothetical protein OS133_07085 [Shewanella fidelis]|uniref:Uncharacterized protein n=1 Tax=Shewanella fidelis TaxID=173509 RepID=A0AAW8NJR5_9GAMM|nr:hypothetical protein [Shewanella fidelis]MDR8523453.1 hypothetical protein [Shewanella fidelis]MDW4817315.1 hypothetical protein [Shewanella fidelis]